MPFLHRLSFRQYLLLAFLLVAGLLAIAPLRGLLALEHLVSQSHDSVSQAARLSADVQLLAERSISMERAARQFLILDDDALRQRFDEAARDASEILGRLEKVLPEKDVIQEWRAQSSVVVAQLKGTQASVAQREQRLGGVFRRLDVLNAALAGQVRLVISHQSEATLAELDEGRRQLGRQMLAVVVLAIALALGFGYWFGRPLKRLESAIDDMGASRFENEVVIPGPADLRALGRRLDWLRLRLAELDADKARFLRHVSHELKTPLAALREGVALLEDGVTGELGEEQREVVGILRQHVQVLQEQIESLLGFNAAAFEARRLSPRRAELSGLVQKVVDSQRLQWQSRRLDVQIAGGPVHAEVDTEKFAAVMGNLLSNAIRFSPPGGRIAIAFTRQPRTVTIDITDQGPGVAPADRELIFEPFYRGERQAADAPKGSGIGLSIVREYVAAHGGRIELLPTEVGAHFHVEFPHAEK